MQCYLVFLFCMYERESLILNPIRFSRKRCSNVYFYPYIRDSVKFYSFYSFIRERSIFWTLYLYLTAGRNSASWTPPPPKKSTKISTLRQGWSYSDVRYRLQYYLISNKWEEKKRENWSIIKMEMNIGINTSWYEHPCSDQSVSFEGMPNQRVHHHNKQVT